MRPWDSVESEELLRRDPWVVVRRDRLVLPGGSTADYFRVDLPDYAMVVPFTRTGSIVLVEGYRPGYNRVALGPPGGMLEKGEVPLSAARRELLEETGFISDDWQFHGAFTVDGNRGCGTMHLFSCRGARRESAVRLDPGEALSVVQMTRAEIQLAMANGRVAGLAELASLATVLLGESSGQSA
jgi:ADP-ribose pyrophosphatase